MKRPSPMSADPSRTDNQTFSISECNNCRVETQGGTVYWISAADDAGTRWIVREHLQSSDTDTMVMQKFSASGSIDLGDKFRGTLCEDIRVGSPLVLQVHESDTRIVSEGVVDIEKGNVPAMIFG